MNNNKNNEVYELIFKGEKGAFCKLKGDGKILFSHKNSRIGAAPGISCIYPPTNDMPDKKFGFFRTKFNVQTESIDKEMLANEASKVNLSGYESKYHGGFFKPKGFQNEIYVLFYDNDDDVPENSPWYVFYQFSGKTRWIKYQTNPEIRKYLTANILTPAGDKYETYNLPLEMLSDRKKTYTPKDRFMEKCIRLYSNMTKDEKEAFESVSLLGGTYFVVRSKDSVNFYITQERVGKNNEIQEVFSKVPEEFVKGEQICVYQKKDIVEYAKKNLISLSKPNFDFYSTHIYHKDIAFGVGKVYMYLGANYSEADLYNEEIASQVDESKKVLEDAVTTVAKQMSQKTKMEALREIRLENVIGAETE